MKTTAALFVLQAGALLAWAGRSEYVRANAPTFRIPLELRDPYDLVRGRYFRIQPQDARLSARAPGARLTSSDIEAFAGPLTPFESVAADVGFCPERAHYRVCALVRAGEDTSTRTASFWARARVSASPEWTGGKREGRELSIDLGISRFFIPNRAALPAREQDPGWELEVAHRPGQTLLPVRLWFEGKPVAFD